MINFRCLRASAEVRFEILPGDKDQRAVAREHVRPILKSCGTTFALCVLLRRQTGNAGGTLASIPNTKMK